MIGTPNELAVVVGGNRDDGSRLGARLWRLAGLLFAASASVGCGGAAEERCEGDECEPLPRSCLYDEVSYAQGASMPAGDGCNTCWCDGGSWNCTAVGCRGESCLYGGQIRADGSSFPAADGCNQCGCNDGEVACTERACTTVPRSCEVNGQLLASGALVPGSSACNACTCMDGEVVCSLIDCNPGCYGDGDCGESQYCAFPLGTCGYGSAGASADRAEEPARTAPLPAGECRDRATLCVADPAPVCGCDGQTYYSSCAAASLGLNLASAGPCAE